MARATLNGLAGRVARGPPVFLHCKASAKNLGKYVSWGHSLFGLILSALLSSPENKEENLS